MSLVKDLAEIERQLDELSIPLLVPLRMVKVLEPGLMQRLLTLGDELSEAVAGVAVVPKSLVGKAYFLFTTMIAEAEHTQTPEAILDGAWKWQECLRAAFGPHF